MNKKLDYWILLPTLMLITLGVTMVYSASPFYAELKGYSSDFFLRKSLFFAPLGVGLLFIFYKIDYHYYWRMVYPLVAMALFLCVLVTFTPLGAAKNGATRWLNLAGFSFQPSEVVKLSVILFMAYSLAKKREKIENFKVGVLPILLVMASLLGMVLLQRDLGTAFILTLLCLILLFVGGTKGSYFVSAALFAVPAFYFLVYRVDFRMRRLMVFRDPWADPYKDGLQNIQSSIAFYNGGLFGVGFAEGIQKRHLPEPHTDFILAIIGEELGMVSVLGILVLFSVLIIRGFQVAFRSQDLFGKYIALGISSLFAIQSIMNFAVVMRLMPTTGLPLPFISYGGSALLISCIAIGVLLNVASQTQQVVESSERPEKNLNLFKKDRVLTFGES